MKLNMEALMFIGVFFILIGFVLVFAGSIFLGKSGSESKTNVAFGGFIGPFPFGFANNPVMGYILVGLMAATLIVWYVFRFYKG